MECVRVTVAMLQRTVCLKLNGECFETTGFEHTPQRPSMYSDWPNRVPKVRSKKSVKI